MCSHVFADGVYCQRGGVVGEWEERRQGGEQGEVMGTGGERGAK